jgi:hypothetical protein
MSVHYFHYHGKLREVWYPAPIKWIIDGARWIFVRMR